MKYTNEIICKERVTKLQGFNDMAGNIMIYFQLNHCMNMLFSCQSL